MDLQKNAKISLDKLSNVNALKEVMTQRQPIKSVRNRYVFSTCYAKWITEICDELKIREKDQENNETELFAAFCHCIEGCQHTKCHSGGDHNRWRMMTAHTSWQSTWWWWRWWSAVKVITNIEDRCLWENNHLHCSAFYMKVCWSNHRLCLSKWKHATYVNGQAQFSSLQIILTSYYCIHSQQFNIGIF